MPVKRKKKSAKRAPARGAAVCLYVGTRKGAFLLRSDLGRKKWKIEGPHFSGWEVNHVIRDPRSGKVWAAVNSRLRAARALPTWWGNDLQVSEDEGRRWRKAGQGLGFTAEQGLTLNRLWYVRPDRASRPGTLWCGADPAALFRTDDGGATWHEVAGLTHHATRDQWDAGGGGMMVHSILLDPGDERRMGVGISVAGYFHSEDDGQTWEPRNHGVLADFQATPYPEVGQCVHALAMSLQEPGWLFQQNHCGVYRSRNAGKTWGDISHGLPSRFGFALAVNPHEKQTLYVVPETSPDHRYAADARLSVWKSRDGGNHWQRLIRGLPQEHVYDQVLRHALTTDTCQPAGVYMGTSGGDLYCSLDGGQSWELLHAHFPTILSVEAAVL